MSITDAEDRLYSSLVSARDATGGYQRAIDLIRDGIGSFADVVGVGVDTNILKMLRRDTAAAERILASIQDTGVSLMIPGQVVVEFWNNHHVFASDEWGKFSNDLNKLARRVSSDRALLDWKDSRIEEIDRLVQELSSELQETKSPEYLSRSQTLMEAVLEAGRVTMVSRERFHSLANARLASKIPPGFADGAAKTNALGDVLVWFDFLLSATVRVGEDSAAEGQFVWVTDDSKADWKTGGSSHPALVEEFLHVTGCELHILSYAEFNGVLGSDIA